MKVNKAKILVIDDNRDIRDSIEAGLELSGVELTIAKASNAVMGLQSAKTNPPDVIILDLQMPGGSGFDFMIELKKDPRLKTVNVIMLTAVDSQANLWKSIEHDVDDFLSKPFDLSELEAHVKNLLEKDQGTSTRI